ncbi:MAG TPA: HAD-IA family hydrolase [Anaerolineae bacterium]
MIEAIVFDFDGLILDTELCDYLSWKETYEDLGCELSLEKWTANIGSVDFFNPYLELQAQLGREVDLDAVYARRKQRDRELLAEQVTLPGVEAYLEEAAALGLKVAIASSARRAWVEEHLGRLSLDHHFAAIRCRDDVGGCSKPDPAVYLAVLAALDVEPNRALALEDSPNGVWAAKRAGLYCVAVPNQMTRNLNFDHADCRLASLDEISLGQLVARCVRKRPATDDRGKDSSSKTHRNSRV